MTAPRDYRDFLKDMVQACRAMIAFVEGMSFDDYLADQKTRYAVMRAYEILGRWATMAAVPNRIVHGYFGIDDAVLFTAIEQDVKPLLPRLEAPAREYGVGE